MSKKNNPCDGISTPYVKDDDKKQKAPDEIYEDSLENWRKEMSLYILARKTELKYLRDMVAIHKSQIELLEKEIEMETKRLLES